MWETWVPSLGWKDPLKILPANAGDPGLIPGAGRIPEKGIGNLLQSSCLGNPMDKGAWRVAVRGVARVGHDLATKHTTVSVVKGYSKNEQLLHSLYTNITLR